MSMQDLAFPRSGASAPPAKRMLVITLPWPDSCLMPNRRNGRHWSATQAAKAKARSDGFYLAKQAAIGQAIREVGRLPMRITFAAPNLIRRDMDNLHAALKAALDGVAKGLGVDDSRFRPIVLDDSLDPTKRGYVKLEIEL